MCYNQENNRLVKYVDRDEMEWYIKHDYAFTLSKMDYARQQGIEAGRKEGVMNNLYTILKIKFPNQNVEWIYECNEKQISIINELVIRDINYHELIKKVEGFKE